MKYSDLFNLENIYLHSIGEPQENHVRFTFYRSRTNPVAESININSTIIKGLHSISPDYTLPLIQMDFERYIGYSVLNESYTVWDDYETFEGKIFRIYSKSRYLDFLKVSTIATNDFPGPFTHYGIACLNHTIDIVSVSEPVIKEIEV